MSKYNLPQDYPIAERVAIITKELAAGNDMYCIAAMFGVGKDCIQYHYKRYILGIEPKKKNKSQKPHWLSYC